MTLLCRRDFVTRCGLAAIGGLLLPSLVSSVSLQAAVPANRFLTAGDQTVLKLLSKYGADTYLHGSSVFARAAGVAATGDPVEVLVLVNDYEKLFAFLHSAAIKRLGVVRADGNRLNFRFRGTAYTVTNAGADDFRQTVANLSSTAAGASGTTVAAAFTYQTLLYHPSTDAVLDPALSLKKQRIELAAQPTGDLKSQFQTVLQGWLAAKQYGLPFGKMFKKFQRALLTSETTPAAAQQVAQAFVQNITALSSAYDAASLRTLLLSPLVAGSLNTVLHVNAEAVADRVEALRSTTAADTSDAAIWLAVLLAPQLKDGTAGQWINGTDAPSRVALDAASQLAQG